MIPKIHEYFKKIVKSFERYKAISKIHEEYENIEKSIKQ